MSGLYDLLPGRPDFDVAVFKLSKLCKRGHDWLGTGQSLRRKNCGHCVECEKERHRNCIVDPQKHREYQQAYLARLGKNEVKRRQRERWLNMPQNQRQRRIEHKRKRREELRLQGFTDRGSPVKNPLMQASLTANKETRNMWQSIKTAGSAPTVPQLVATAQCEYWNDNPDAYKKYSNKKKKQYHEWRCLIDKAYQDSYLLYHRQKSKRRKAQMRDSVAIQLTGRQVRERFRQFDNRCAYCGCTGDLHIEHVVPISKGGTHAMGNIIPACKDCNFSKRDHEVESWYRAQPFFSELRWRKICRVLGWGRSSVGQLALL
jgi:5-methylcytosine-specific restriction endonuclease McrA